MADVFQPKILVWCSLGLLLEASTWGEHISKD